MNFPSEINRGFLGHPDDLDGLPAPEGHISGREPPEEEEVIDVWLLETLGEGKGVTPHEKNVEKPGLVNFQED